ncbi:hypothetical protein [Brucella gallinifaecis]|uniref:hypothetical protein n=1 Tax=Brucella gallinifaecis TaxID=215590 RepID=UPI00235F77C3|nr:hypothetical protein [Brucella gallinifaecis]
MTRHAVDAWFNGTVASLAAGVFDLPTVFSLGGGIVGAGRTALLNCIKSLLRKADTHATTRICVSFDRHQCSYFVHDNERVKHVAFHVAWICRVFL